ncbi:MAG: hypothetical protein HKN26_07105, partial [Acidimicrobiales bacterium]|nr:hypothetical protein [Acidimicrobiales bacterium]
MTLGDSPALVVAGFMKCATTTMYTWLAAQPEFSSTGSKETNFLAHDDLWRQGPSRYAELLGAGGGELLLDVSPSYLSPEFTERAATRFVELAIDAPVAVLYRDPVERAVSHLRHQVRRGRVAVDLDAAAAELTADSPYVQASRYRNCLEPWLQRLDPDRMVFIDQADLATGWRSVLAAVGLEWRPPPTESANVASDLPAYSPLARALVDRGFSRPPAWVPAWSRRVGRRLLLRSPVASAPPIDAIRDAMPSESRALLDTD